MVPSRSHHGASLGPLCIKANLWPPAVGSLSPSLGYPASLAWHTCRGLSQCYRDFTASSRSLHPTECWLFPFPSASDTWRLASRGAWTAARLCYPHSWQIHKSCTCAQVHPRPCWAPETQEPRPTQATLTLQLTPHVKYRLTVANARRLKLTIATKYTFRYLAHI